MKKRKTRGQQKSYADNGPDECCALCGLSDTDPDQFGEKVTLKQHNLTVHYFCLLTSSGVYQRGEEDEGVFGFLVDDIKQEIRRSARLLCCGCKKKGASVGCFVSSCRKKVHFPCGRKQKFISQFSGLFPSYCKDHSPVQSVSGCSELSLPQSCSVCLDPIEPLLSYNVLKCPACHTSWFHRDCVQRQAHSAGLYFFRCTLCNNKDSFQEEMLRMGIYIPERDASWELESNAYEELLEVYQHCDALTCLCKNGRTHSAKAGWFELVRCRLCGSKGTHRKCSELMVDTTDWACLDCTQAVDGKASLVPRASPPGSQRRSLLSKRCSSIQSPINCKRSLLSGGSPEEFLQALALQLLPPKTQTSPSTSPRSSPQTQTTCLLIQPPSSTPKPSSPAHTCLAACQPSLQTSPQTSTSTSPQSQTQAQAQSQSQSPCSLVEVCGQQALSAGLALVRSNDFKPTHRLSVRFKGDQKTLFPSCPSGSDAARRHFLKLLVQQIQNCAVFEGPDGSKNLALDSQALREDLYFDVGCLLALSLVHGGPPLLFLSPALYQCLFNFPRDAPLTLTHMTHNTHFTHRLSMIAEAKTLEDLKEAMAASWEYLELAGCNRPISSLDEREALVEDLVSFTMITRMQLPLQRFREGLRTLGVFEQVQLFPALFSRLFCGPADVLTAQSISDLFTVCFSRQQDRQDREMPTITFWRHFLLECEVGRCSISLQDLLCFTTGVEEVPTAGLHPPPSLSFLHARRPPGPLRGEQGGREGLRSRGGKAGSLLEEEEEEKEGWRDEGLFPQSQPRNNHLTLPVTSTYQAFKSSMEQAVSHYTHLPKTES
ncbi:G2/M phase-specific E3 ubiquitin-protein ligase [Polymixia lowei]